LWKVQGSLSVRSSGDIPCMVFPPGFSCRKVGPDARINAGDQSEWSGEAPCSVASRCEGATMNLPLTHLGTAGPRVVHPLHLERCIHGQPIVTSADRLPDAMSAWEKFANNEAPDRLVQLAILHAEFEALHPFLDRNGRL